MAWQVAVCGPAVCTEQQRRSAEHLGRLLANGGAVVLCGGRATGVMGAVAAGVRSANGTIVGVLPGMSGTDAAPGLTATVRTGLGEARNAVLVNSADAVVVVGGSWGTLSEVALAAHRGGVPVISLGGWRVIDAAGEPVPGVRHVTSVEKAAALALAPPQQPTPA